MRPQETPPGRLALMLASWLDFSPWSILLEGSSQGVPYSYFANFKAFGGSYAIYITDLVTIWSETVDTEAIKTKLAPYQNFLELPVPDLLRILTDLLARPENIDKLSLRPAKDEGLTVGCGAQLGIVEFNWSFECRPIDRRLAGQHIRSRFTIPALLLAGSQLSEVYTNETSISREQYQRFQSRKSCQPPGVAVATAPILLNANPPLETLDPVTSKFTMAIGSEIIAPQQETPVPVPALPTLPVVGTELERRKHLQSMLAASRMKANEKKRKLI